MVRPRIKTVGPASSARARQPYRLRGIGGDSWTILTTSWPRPAIPGAKPGRAGVCPARCAAACSQPRQEAVERAADRRLRRCRSCPILEPHAARPPSGSPSPDRSHPGAGWHRSTRGTRRPGPGHRHRRGGLGKPHAPPGPELTQLSNSDVAVHWVLVDSGRLDLGTLGTRRASGTTEWHLHSPGEATPARAEAEASPAGSAGTAGRGLAS